MKRNSFLCWMLLTIFSHDVQAGGTLGGYGFLTRFEEMPEAQARLIIRQMTALGVKEFQFYDWFADYSTPVSGACWADPFFHRRQSCLETIKIYIDEIRRQGGRSWAYVQSVAAEYGVIPDTNTSVSKLIDRDGNWHWHANRFPTYFANSAWANEMVRTWAPKVAELGFDGIHWDTLGPIAGDYGAETFAFHRFLKTAKKGLRHYNLKQTANFVSLAWWDNAVIKSVVEFPYAEVWSEEEKLRYFVQMQSDELKGTWGVIAYYPSVGLDGNQTESETMILRRQDAKLHNLQYALIADGSSRVTTEYIPATLKLTKDEMSRLID